MIIRTISDIHGNLPPIKECDILIIAGDICPDYDLVKQGHWLDTKFRDWLNEIPAKNIVGVAGNHDLVFERNPTLVPRDLRWTYLQNTSTVIEGFRIYGTPYILPIWGAFQSKENSLKARYDLIADDIDILISHGPPYGYGDEALALIPQDDEKWPELEHCGSKALLERIYKISPKLVVWGHIHEAYGIHYISSNILGVNAAMVDRHHNIKNNPVEIVFEDRQIKSYLAGNLI